MASAIALAAKPSIQLTLEPEEAQVIFDILHTNVCGHSERSRRKYTDRVHQALASVGMSATYSYDKNNRGEQDYRGSLIEFLERGDV